MTAPASEPMATQVFAAPKGTRIYAVGDVHGRASLLAKMLSSIAQDAKEHPASHIVQMFLGDYIDRGLHSREVIDLLIAAPPPGQDRICLLGNHEEAFLRFLEDPATLRSWANFGGYATLMSYGLEFPQTMSPEVCVQLRDQLRQKLPQAHAEFFKKLPLTHQIGDYLFVHAGVMPGIPMEQQKREHLLGIRESFLRHMGYFDHYIVHGHSPVKEPHILPHRANLDVSAAEKDMLCCLVLENEARRILIVTDE